MDTNHTQGLHGRWMALVLLGGPLAPPSPPPPSPPAPAPAPGPMPVAPHFLEGDCPGCGRHARLWQRPDGGLGTNAHDPGCPLLEPLRLWRAWGEPWPLRAAS